MADMEAEKKGSPEELREALLQQVKTDNQEIASMERRITEIQSQITAVQDELDEEEDADNEREDPAHEEKRLKYIELLKREGDMQTFLDTFEDNKQLEIEQSEKAQQNIVALLEHTSRNLARGGQLPSQSEHDHLKEDLAFKAREMEKSQLTAESKSTLQAH